MLKIEKRAKNLKKFNNNNDNTTVSKSLISSTLCLVDLAGSERVKKSLSSGERLNEAKSINLSLTALGKCIHSLTDSSNFIPFRESKLTRILQDSLGGNCKTVLIVTIGPATKFIDETISSLNFGMRAMKVENRPIVNKNIDYFELVMKLQAEVDEKDDQIHKLEISQGKLLDMMKNLKQVKRDFF